MIIFHEGLPGSGKSYEAMQARIVPSIAAGREVVAYVEGLDHAKIAELAGVTVERCRELLHSVTREDMQKDWLAHCRDNAMHVFDEAQNFWGNRARLTAEQTQLVTEHRHRGMDIVLMGQDLRDVHATWRRRVELKLCFLKLNAFKVPPFVRALTFGKLGTGNGYSVTTYRHLGGDEFKRLGLVLRSYDPKFFGTYKSHVADDTNTEVYTDDRAQIWNHPLLRYAVPASVAAAALGLYYAWSFFHPAGVTEAKAPPPAPSPVARVASGPAGPAVIARAASAPAVVADDGRPPIERRMAELATKGRIRLAGLISSRDHINGVVEWVQGGSTVVERLSLDGLRLLGVGVLVTGDVVQLAVGDYRELATPWPLEDMARVSASRQEAIRGPQPATAAAPMPAEVAQLGSAPSFVDMPGPITGDPDAGNLQRRVRRIAH